MFLMPISSWGYVVVIGYGTMVVNEESGDVG
jgi:hypothetical protein